MEKSENTGDIYIYIFLNASIHVQTTYLGATIQGLLGSDDGDVAKATVHEQLELRKEY